MPESPVNPLRADSLTVENVEPGLRFTWYPPGRSGSIEHGVFLSKPYEDGEGELFVDIRVDNFGGFQSISLAVLGIIPAPNGRWLACFTLAENARHLKVV